MHIVSEELIREGYWSIATQKHLINYTADSSNIDELDSLNVAGKAGRFLGAIRKNKRVENMRKLEKMANNVGISRSDLHRIILPEIEKASDGKVELIKNTVGEVTGIQEYLFDNSTVLDISGQVFEQQRPTEIERIAVFTMDETRKIPYLESELSDYLAKSGFTEEGINVSLALQEQFNLIQRLRPTKQVDPIISNEYVWGSNHAKIATAITSLDLGQKQTLRDVIEIIQNKQGVPVENLPPIDTNILSLAQKTGMILPTKIISLRGLEKSFAFSANLQGDIGYQDDILDDVKLLLASIRFGQNYTLYSKITDPRRFLTALINRDYVGPHSANETDYTLLEKRGIVKVETKSSYNSFTGNVRTGACLKLLRKDVAEHALSLLSEPQYSMGGGNNYGSAEAILSASTFVSPEESRIKLGVLPKPVQEAEEYLSRVLRDELL